MPIRPELRHLYRGPIWEAVRARILARAGNRCEQCGKPNDAIVETVTGQSRFYQRMDCAPFMWWRTIRPWTDENGREWPAFEIRAETRFIRVQLGIAHLNHTPGDDRDENLKALCNWCHLHYDQLQHKATRAKRKDAGRPLLQEAS